MIENIGEEKSQQKTEIKQINKLTEEQMQIERIKFWNNVKGFILVVLLFLLGSLIENL